MEDDLDANADNCDAAIPPAVEKPAPQKTGKASGKADNGSHATLQDEMPDVSDRATIPDGDGDKTDNAEATAVAADEVRAENAQPLNRTLNP